MKNKKNILLKHVRQKHVLLCHTTLIQYLLIVHVLFFIVGTFPCKFHKSNQSSLGMDLETCERTCAVISVFRQSRPIPHASSQHIVSHDLSTETSSIYM